MSGPLPHPRDDYERGALRRADVAGRPPLDVVRDWIAAAAAAGVPEPTAATLATVDEHGLPDARVVLVRDLGPDGAVWYSNRTSAKGRQLAATPAAALVWFWPSLERQVRLRGPVEPVDDATSDAYWAGRPRASQLASSISDQSSVVADRAALEDRLAEVTRAHPDDQPVPRPGHWGGSRLRPVSVELWQGRPARLHDRLRWERATPDDAQGWTLSRLMP